VTPGEHMVFVVDDDSEIREALESLLRSAEFSAVTFSSAEDVLKSGLLAEASCLITDTLMPGMPGLELLRRIQREYPKLPAIIITGHSDEQTRQNALSGGAVAFIYKPVDPNDLLRAVYSAIANSEKAI
jgi:two-component system nitrogen regulation response regulator GlnG